MEQRDRGPQRPGQAASEPDSVLARGASGGADQETAEVTSAAFDHQDRGGDMLGDMQRHRA